MKNKGKIIIANIIAPILTTTTTLATDITIANEPARDDFKGMGETVVSILSSIGIVISVIMLAILGIKYMVGSVEERADYKKSFMPYIIGAGLLFGASTIAQIIYLFVN